jgi:hypothetical protein
MPSKCAARRVEPQRYTGAGRGGLLPYISARFSESFIPRVDESSVGAQALALAAHEFLSGICQIRSQCVRHTLR